MIKIWAEPEPRGNFTGFTNQYDHEIIWYRVKSDDKDVQYMIEKNIYSPHTYEGYLYRHVFLENPDRVLTYDSFMMYSQAADDYYS